MSEDDVKYKELINVLKSLPEVNAPKNFETTLMHRINTGNFKAKLSLWDKIFLPSRFIPSAALAVTAVIILFVMNINSGDIDNPLLIEPRIREDIFANIERISFEDRYSIPVSKTDGKKKAEEYRNTEKVRSISSEEIKSRKENIITDDTNVAELKVDKLQSKRNEAGFSKETSVTAASFIDKRGLNFRQINLNEEEKIIVNRLKERVKSLFKKSKN